jgi:hypothetical protein
MGSFAARFRVRGLTDISLCGCLKATARLYLPQVRHDTGACATRSHEEHWSDPGTSVEYAGLRVVGDATIQKDANHGIGAKVSFVRTGQAARWVVISVEAATAPPVSTQLANLPCPERLQISFPQLPKTPVPRITYSRKYGW